MRGVSVLHVLAFESSSCPVMTHQCGYDAAEQRPAAAQASYSKRSVVVAGYANHQLGESTADGSL